jgi:ketosteroid isomerase-like protein
MNDSEDVLALAKQCFKAYETKDRQAMEKLLHDHFTFTSPQDDHISRADYWARCWPFSEQWPAFSFDKTAVNGKDAFILYTCQTKEGKRFRNTEVFRAEGGKIISVEVFFGDTLK